jgi:uncharacterized protein YkwD
MSRKGWITALTTGIVAAGLVVAGPVTAEALPSAAPVVKPQWVSWPTETTDAETQMLDRLNVARAELGLQALVRIPTLDTFAREWSTFMAGGGCQELQGSNLCHRSNLSLVATLASPKGWTWTGENVGRIPDGGSLDALHNAFMNSPSHRENVLNLYYNAVGVGVAYDANGMLYITFEFIATNGEPNTTGPVAGFPELPGEMSNEDAFVYYLNYLRERAGLRPLVRNAVLDRETEYWSQRRLDGACGPDVRLCYRRDLGSVVKAAVGLGRSSWWGDLVGVTPASEPSAQLSWFTSSAAMRRVLMRRDINSIGVGIVTNADGVSFMSVTVLTARNAIHPHPRGGSQCGWVQSTLRVGSKGSAVRVLQCALAEKGFWTGAIDGNLTSEVGAALKSFQRSKKYRATGMTDLRTRRALGVS